MESLLNDSGGKEPSYALILLFHAALDRLDSISILMEKSSLEGASICLRGFVEAIINIEALIKKDFSVRGYAVLYWLIINELHQLKQECPKYYEGKALEEMLLKDLYLKPQPLFKGDIDSIINAYEELLQQRKFKKMTNTHAR